MKIRSITLLAEPALDPERAKRFFQVARDAFPMEVQSLRLATTPFPTWWNRDHFSALQANEVAERWRAAGAEVVALGPVLLRHDAGWLDQLPEIVAAGDGLFVAAEIADQGGVIDVGRCQAVAGVIRRLSMLARDGSANFYFAALANCSSGAPLFPVAYHQGGSPRFAIALEAAGLFFDSIDGATTLLGSQQALQSAIEEQARRLTAAAQHLAEMTGVTFAGIDFSPAPALPPGRGLAQALEAVGVGGLGEPGSLFAAAFVADAIGRSEFQRAGFSGLTFPVLEDGLLAERAAAGLVSVYDLLAHSAVCGTGLDTVPLPGDIGQETLAAILLDVAALAVRLDKPLTARLMPMPGLAAGDPVAVDLPYVIDGRVMAVAEGQGDALRQITRLQMKPYHQREAW
jgi:uncharacterized protein (UPF0210 family)